MKTDILNVKASLNMARQKLGKLELLAEPRLSETDKILLTSIRHELNDAEESIQSIATAHVLAEKNTSGN